MCKLFSPPPPKQTKWYWTVLFFVTTLWCLGGINVLLLQDIPLLLFLGIFLVLIHLPVARYIGRPQRRWIDLVWRFVVIAAMIALALFVIPPFSISLQTTYLTEPRSKEHFGIDYQTVIEKQLDPKVPAEENGFRLLTESLGRPFFGEQFKNRHWSRLCQYLDLPTEIDPKLSFIDWRTYTKTLKPEENELLEKSSCRNETLPWSEEAMLIVQPWLDENNAVLDLFVNATRKSALYAPPMFDGLLINTILTNDETCRRMTQSLHVRVRYRLATGEINLAWDNVLAMYHLAAQHRRAVWNVISSLLNNAMMNTANRCAEAVLIHSDWCSDEIRRKTFLAGLVAEYGDATFRLSPKNVLGIRLSGEIRLPRGYAAY